VKLQYLDRWTAARQENARYYDGAFTRAGTTNPVSTPHRVPGYRHILNQYVLRAERRDELKQWLTENGVGTEIYYPIPLHMQKCFDYLGHNPDDCPESRRAALETLAIPIYPELTAAQRQHVGETTLSFYH
jgi:dTDP-4-amino-4,6-dideoxygalactose transaminase